MPTTLPRKGQTTNDTSRIEHPKSNQRWMEEKNPAWASTSFKWLSQNSHKLPNLLNRRAHKETSQAITSTMTNHQAPSTLENLENVYRDGHCFSMFYHIFVNFYQISKKWPFTYYKYFIYDNIMNIIVKNKVCKVSLQVKSIGSSNYMLFIHRLLRRVKFLVCWS